MLIASVSKEYTVSAPITSGLYTVWDANDLELTITFFTYREKNAALIVILLTLDFGH